MMWHWFLEDFHYCPIILIRNHFKKIIMKIKGSSEGMSCDCILGKDGLLLKFKGFFGGDKGEELIKYSDITNISLAKTAGLVSSPLLLIEKPDGIKKVVLLDKHFKMFYELLESNINPQIQGDTPSEVLDKSSGRLPGEMVDKSSKEAVTEPIGEGVDESIHFKRIEEAKKLLNMGAITEEEFNLIKNKHLKKM